MLRMLCMHDDSMLEVCQRLKEISSMQKRSSDTGRQRSACTPQIDQTLILIQVSISSHLVWKTLREYASGLSSKNGNQSMVFTES